MKNRRFLAIIMTVRLGLRSSGAITLYENHNRRHSHRPGAICRFDVADFENRGLLDLFVADYGGANVFYRNNGDGTFTSVTQGLLLQYVPYETGAPVADFDNDGYLDAAIVAGSGAPAPGNELLYHNNGDGSFVADSGGGVTNIPGYFNVGA